MKVNFLIVITSCLLIACDNQSSEPTASSELPKNTVNIKPYYYPLEDLKEGKVYEYKMVDKGEEFVSHYALLQSEEKEGNTYLNMQEFNPVFQPTMTIQQWIIPDGVITKAYKFHVWDSVQQANVVIENKISQSVVFPFLASTDSVMAYRFECESKLPPEYLTVKLLRDRKFQELSTFEYEGKTLETAVLWLSDIFDIEDKDKGGFWQQEKNGVEIYGKGVGLIYKETFTPETKQLEVMKLTKVYTIEEFEKLKEL